MCSSLGHWTMQWINYRLGGVIFSHPWCCVFVSCLPLCCQITKPLTVPACTCIRYIRCHIVDTLTVTEHLGTIFTNFYHICCEAFPATYDTHDFQFHSSWYFQSWIIWLQADDQQNCMHTIIKQVRKSNARLIYVVWLLILVYLMRLKYCQQFKNRFKLTECQVTVTASHSLTYAEWGNSQTTVKTKKTHKLHWCSL